MRLGFATFCPEIQSSPPRFTLLRNWRQPEFSTGAWPLSCSYETYSLPHASANPPFFLTGSSGQDHRLALPVKPCRGVEDIATDKDCGGEDIWDWAWGQVSGKSSISSFHRHYWHLN